MVDSQNRWLLDTSISIMYEIGDFNWENKKFRIVFLINHGRIKSFAGHTVYAYSSGLRAVQFLLRNYATRVDKKRIAPEQGFILLVIWMKHGK